MNEKIKLIKKSYRSDFLQGLLEEELGDIVQKNFLLKNSLNFLINYIYRGTLELEVGIFIINKTVEDIFIEELPFKLVDNEGLEINKFSFKILEDIKIGEASFLEVKIPCKNLEDIETKEENLILSIGEVDNLKVFNGYKVEVQNLNDIKKYSAVRALKKFTNNLPLITEETLDVNLFSITENNGEVVIILYFRNSSKRDLSIKSLPLNIYSRNNLLAYRKILLLEDNSLVVPKESGIFFRKTINTEEIPLDPADIEYCRIDFLR